MKNGLYLFLSFLSELTALQTFIFLQIMFCNHTWIVSYTSIYNSYFPLGNSFEKRTVAAWSDNESRRILESPAIEPVFHRLSHSGNLQVWARSEQSYLLPISSPKYSLLPRMFIQPFFLVVFCMFSCLT